MSLSSLNARSTSYAIAILLLLGDSDRANSRVTSRPCSIFIKIMKAKEERNNQVLFHREERKEKDIVERKTK